MSIMSKFFFFLLAVSAASGLRATLRMQQQQASISSSSSSLDALKLPPGNKGKWPLFGDTFQLINAKTMGTYQTKSRERYGDVWKTNIFFTPTVFVTGSENLKGIFVEEAKKKTSAFFPPHHKKLFGENSLLVQSGPYHAKLRRIIQQSLSPQAIAQLDPLITTKVRSFIAECKQEGGENKDYFKFADKCKRFFIRLAVGVLLGDEISETDLESLAEDLSLWSKGLLSAPITFIPWSTASRAMRARKRVARRITEFIDKYREGASSSSSSSNSNNKNLLFRLVTTKDDVENDFLSSEAIVDNLFTLIFAGSDTTASAMTSTIKILSLDSELQEKLRNAFAGEASTSESAQQAIDLLIQEVFARNPPAPFAMRLVGDEPLFVNGYQVPSNWLLAYGYAGTLLGETDKESKISIDLSTLSSPSPSSSSSEKSVAFGGGPRMCPGRFLAIKELKLLCSEILGANGFRWSLDPEQNLEQTYTPGFFPLDGLRIKVA